MRIAITGASGLVGRALTSALEQDGHVVQRLVRRSTSDPQEVSWSPAEATLDAEKLIGTDAVVHLAGEPLIGLRWTDAKKRRILRSRVDGTALVADSLAGLSGGPRILISTSAVGYYGDGRAWVDEDAPRGEGFLADVCSAWEAAAEPARDAGVRVVHPRLGLVLSTAGGVLKEMLPAFRLGVGGPIGDGTQYFPWIAIDDVVGAIRFALHNEVDGPLNLAAPGAVTNAEFTSALSGALHRPAFVRLPKFAIRAALGEMGRELLLAGQRVRPQRLLDVGFSFEYPELGPALDHLLSR